MPHDKQSPPQLATDHDQRHAQVAGAGPRLPPLAVQDLSDEALQLVAGMIHLNTAFESRDQKTLDDLLKTHATGSSAHAELPEIIRTMLRHPDLFKLQLEVSGQLLTRGALPARDRELVILRMGWLCRAPYEWGEHVHIGKTAGITPEEIERITRGSSAPGWSEHDRALLRATEELHADAMISDPTWATLAKRFNDRQLIELPIVIGQYQTTAYYQNALRLRLNDGNPGLRAR